MIAESFLLGSYKKSEVLLVVAAVCLAGCLGRPSYDREPVRLDAKWCSLGTSITWYNSCAGGKFWRGYQDRVLDRLDFAAFSNRGVNGGCIASAIRVVETADVYTVEHGVNDWGRGVKVGRMADYLNDTGDRTFFGAYRKVVDRMRACNPKAAVVLCTPRKSYGFGTYLPAKWSDPNKGTYLEDYVKAVRTIAEHEGFEVADFFAKCGEQEELSSLSIDVALHPNDAGYARMADELVPAMVRAMEKRGLFVPSTRPVDAAKVFKPLDAAGQVRQYVRKDGTVVTHNLTGADYRMADGYVIPAYGVRIDRNKKRGNSRD